MKKLILFVLMMVLSTSTIQALPKHDMHDKAFADMEQKYGVSATFAKAVAIQESGWFTSNAYKNKNNPFGIMSKGKLQRFDSADESIDYFGNLLSSEKYKGMSIEEIGKEYCPTDRNWARDVRWIMRRVKK
mgnify:CR=1 FL=1